MFGRDFDFKCTCSKCGKKIEHHSFDDMCSSMFNNCEVVKIKCSCGHEMLVKLDTILVPDLSYDGSKDAIRNSVALDNHLNLQTQQDLVSSINISRERYKHLLDRGILITKESDNVIDDFSDDDLHPVWY